MRNSFIIIPVLLLVGCVGDPQDIPPGIMEDPVFVADLIFESKEVMLQAGLDGLIMDVSHQTTDRGVVKYSSRFADTDCSGSTCGPTLEIHFWDYGRTGTDTSGADFTFVEGSKAFFNQEQENRVELAISLLNEEPPGYSVWTNPASGVLGNAASVSLVANPDEFIDVCHNSFGPAATGHGSCLSSHCFHMQPSGPGMGWIVVSRMVGNHALVEVAVTGQPPFMYEWMNGATTPFILLPVHDAMTTGVSVTVRDANQNVMEINQTLHLSGGRPILCPANQGFSIDILQAAFSQFNSAELVYTDESGRVYSSANGEQTEANFRLFNVTDFLTAPSGFPTKQLEIQVSATLHPVNGGDPLELTSGSLTIAVSYDE